MTRRESGRFGDITWTRGARRYPEPNQPITERVEHDHRCATDNNCGQWGRVANLYRSSQSEPVLGTDVADRMDDVLRWNKWTGDDWSLKAGLARTHVNTIISRLRAPKDEEGPTKAKGPSIETMAKLAAAADVTLDWLILGKGPPQGRAVDTQDSRYPSRGFVVGWLRFQDGAAALPVIKALQSDSGFVDDPGIEYWFARAKIERARVGANNPEPIRGSKARRTG